MSFELTPGKSVLGGSAVLMVCACGAATNSAKLMGLTAGGGMATSRVMHPVFIGIGAALLLYGLWRIHRASALIAVAAFAVLGVAAAITGPSVMTKAAMPWGAAHMRGAALYLVAAGVLGYAIWRAFPSPNPSAAAGAIGGGALATGCGCCMVTGAAAGMAVTSGADITFVQPSTVLHYVGLTLVAVGLFRMGGWRAAIWVPVGAAVITYAPKALRLTGDWMVGTANLRSLGAWALTVLGAGLIMYGFAVAYKRARLRHPGTEWARLGVTGDAEVLPG